MKLRIHQDRSSRSHRSKSSGSGRTGKEDIKQENSLSSWYFRDSSSKPQQNRPSFLNVDTAKGTGGEVLSSDVSGSQSPINSEGAAGPPSLFNPEDEQQLFRSLRHSSEHPFTTSVGVNQLVALKDMIADLYEELAERFNWLSITEEYEKWKHDALLNVLFDDLKRRLRVELSGFEDSKKRDRDRIEELQKQNRNLLKQVAGLRLKLGARGRRAGAAKATCGEKNGNDEVSEP